MPNVILDRIPLPNLRLYTSVSVLLVSCCVYYAISSTSDPFWRFDNNTTASDSFFSLSPDAIIAGLDSSGIDIEKILDVNHAASADHGGVAKDALDETQQQEMANTVLQYISPDQRKLFNDTRTIGSKVKDVVSFMVQEPICIWVSSADIATSISWMLVCVVDGSTGRVGSSPSRWSGCEYCMRARKCAHELNYNVLCYF